MSSKLVKTGLTLIEILVAVSIIAVIVSMVYGSFKATSRSIEACRTRMTTSSDAYRLLEQIAGQIRCAYTSSVSLTSPKENDESKNKPDYFSSNSNKAPGEILHLVTTRSISIEDNLSEGLFDVTYYFDDSKGMLSINQKPFTGTSENAFEEDFSKVESQKPCQVLAANVASVELAFFDREHWFNKWDFKDKAELPSAVRINLTFREENRRLRDYCVVTYICGQNNQDGPHVKSGAKYLSTGLETGLAPSLMDLAIPYGTGGS